MQEAYVVGAGQSDFGAFPRGLIVRSLQLQMTTEPFEFDRSQEVFEDVISDFHTALNVE